MKQLINRIKDWIEECLRRICGGLTPRKRTLTVVMLIVVFAIVNFYIIFRAIYNIGREDAQPERIDLHVVVPDFELHKQEQAAYEYQMEDFFNELFNSKQDDTTKRE